MGNEVLCACKPRTRYAIDSFVEGNQFLKQAVIPRVDERNHFDFGYEERGLLMLFKTRETEKEELEAANLANKVVLKPAYFLWRKLNIWSLL